MEKQDIINLSSDSSKSYASLVLCDSEFTFPDGEKDTTFCLFLYWVLFIHSVA